MPKRMGCNKLKSIVTETEYLLRFDLFEANRIVKEEIKISVSYNNEVEESFTFADELYFDKLDVLLKYLKFNCSHIFKNLEIVKDLMFTFSLNEDICEVTFDKNLANSLGLDKQKYREKSTGIRKPRILEHHQQMFIYTNIIEPIIVGDSSVPLLKSVWIGKYEHDEVVNINIDNPMYLPIASSCINNIEINIRDDSGKLINFPKGSKTHLTLHFRKVDG